MSPVRVLFITQEDPFYVRIFFEEFLRLYPHREEIVGVAIAPAMGKKSAWTLAQQMYDFYGLANFLRVGMRFALYKIAARLGLGGRPGRFVSIAQVCRHYGARVLTPRDLNGGEFLQQARDLRVDLIASVAAPQIFRQPLIDLPRLGCINIHNSPLPKYRGMLPNFWQMFNGERSLTTSVHRINGALDDGGILLQQSTPLEPDETLHDVMGRTKRTGAHLMMKAIEQIRSGTVREIENSKEQATYYTFPNREQVREFRRRGYRVI